MEANTLKNRLIAYLDFKGIGMSEFGRKIDVSNAYVASIKQNVSLDKLEKIHQEFKELNILWLLFGEGRMCFDVDKLAELEKENTQLKRENELLTKLCREYEHNKNA